MSNIEYYQQKLEDYKEDLHRYENYLERGVKDTELASFTHAVKHTKQQCETYKKLINEEHNKSKR